MSRLFSLLGILASLTFIAAEPVAAPPEAPTDGEVTVDDGAEAMPDQGPSQPEEPAGPMVDSLIYKSWASHEVGTSVKNVSNAKFNGMDIKLNVTSTMTAKTADKVTIETTGTASVGGGPEEAQPKQSEDYPAKVREGQEYLPPNFQGKLNPTGTETLTVNGKPYECRVMEFDGMGDGVQAKGKVWINDQVPGTHLKAVFDMAGDGQSMSFEILVTEFTIK
ncbi:MAG TPA: hypothetical protein PK402_11590 [Tepidisphaeraceae bacterium]|nr:hypothetical protein [Tepidisphaeraceae bacterium]